MGNFYSLRLRDHTEYVKGKVYISMLFAQVGNNPNKQMFSFLQYKGMKHCEQKIDYSSVITYTFTQYYLKSGLKELRAKGAVVVMEELSHIQISNNLCPKLADNLIEEQNQDTLGYLMFSKVKRDGR